MHGKSAVTAALGEIGGSRRPGSIGPNTPTQGTLSAPDAWRSPESMPTNKLQKLIAVIVSSSDRCPTMSTVPGIRGAVIAPLDVWWSAPSWTTVAPVSRFSILTRAVQPSTVHSRTRHEGPTWMPITGVPGGELNPLSDRKRCRIASSTCSLGCLSASVIFSLLAKSSTRCLWEDPVGFSSSSWGANTKS